jgi:D-beta-D-heptose 7-phosphate kinase / D-beta-D-heptose 1-phosphate adenosyltransferase
MFDYQTALEQLAHRTVLCVGDLMLDDFVYGEVSRVSPEAPVPVIVVRREEKVIGGAGNVARNLAGLGARCLFVSVIGADETANLLINAIAGFDLIEPYFVVDASRPTSRKVRFVSEHYSSHLLRADWELANPVSGEIEAQLIRAVTSLIPRADAVVLSGYAKGVLGSRLIRAVTDAAAQKDAPVVVDPKGTDFSIYHGATVITPNRKELAESTRMPVATEPEIIAAAAAVRGAAGARAVLVTLSEEGMLLDAAGAAPVHVPAYPVRVRDVSGAGDTVAAVLAVLLATGADFEAATRAANAAASVVVGKRGTATVTAAELRSRILPAAALAVEEKIAFDPAVAAERVREWRAIGLRIGFTNGCFDILHPGHVHLLTRARAVCDRLVVGLNSDASVKRLKGPDRPIQDVHARGGVLAALEAVDLVAIFEDDTPLELIRRLRPSVLVKGGDYRKETVVGHELVEADGGEVILIDLVPGHSTTRIVERSGGAAANDTRRKEPAKS